MDVADKMVRRAEDARISHWIMVAVLFLQAMATWTWWWALAWVVLFIGLTRAAAMFWFWRFASSDGEDNDGTQGEYESLIRRCRLSRWAIFVLMLAAWGASSIDLESL